MQAVKQRHFLQEDEAVNSLCKRLGEFVNVAYHFIMYPDSREDPVRSWVEFVHRLQVPSAGPPAASPPPGSAAPAPGIASAPATSGQPSSSARPSAASPPHGPATPAPGPASAPDIEEYIAQVCREYPDTFERAKADALKRKR